MTLTSETGNWMAKYVGVGGIGAEDRQLGVVVLARGRHVIHDAVDLGFRVVDIVTEGLL